MEQIRGANLGNWLVLEEWMEVRLDAPAAGRPFAIENIALTGEPSAETDCAEKPTVHAERIEKHFCIHYNKVTRSLEVISEVGKDDDTP